MRIQIAIKKVSETMYEGALIIDGRFQRAVSGSPNAAHTYSQLIGQTMNKAFEVGTEIEYNITAFTQAEIAAQMANQSLPQS